MTILNKKGAAVPFNPSKHYKPGEAILKGRDRIYNKDKSGERNVYDVNPADTLATPTQEGHLYVSRLKSNFDHAEWVQM